MQDGEKLFVYRNITKSKDKHVYSLKSKSTNRVQGHLSELYLTNAKFKVSDTGRERVRREGVKNVHAGIEGVFTLKALRGPWLPVTYDPKKNLGFVRRDTGEPVTEAKAVKLTPEGVMIKAAFTNGFFKVANKQEDSRTHDTITASSASVGAGLGAILAPSKERRKYKDLFNRRKANHAESEHLIAEADKNCHDQFNRAQTYMNNRKAMPLYAKPFKDKFREESIASNNLKKQLKNKKAINAKHFSKYTDMMSRVRKVGRGKMLVGGLAGAAVLGGLGHFGAKALLKKTKDKGNE